MQNLKSGEVLLVNVKTGAVFIADNYALRDRGMPGEEWEDLSEVSKATLINSIRKLNGCRQTLEEVLSLDSENQEDKDHEEV